MKTTTVEVPEDILVLLAGSRLGARSQSDQVRIALATHLFQEGVISIGKAAELAGESRADFESLLIDIGIPVVRYDDAEFERDLRGVAEARQRAIEP